MHTLVAALCLVPLVLLLQGCGGGAPPCTNKAMSLVTQSVDMDGSLKVTMPTTKAAEMSIPLTLVEKIDMESMKWYVKFVMKITVPDPFTPSKPAEPEDMGVTMMMDVATKKLAYGMKMKMPGMPAMDNCTLFSMDWLQSPEVVSKCVKDGFAKDAMAPPKVPGVEFEGPSCEKKDDLDVWTIKFSNNTAQGKLEVEESLSFDKDYLFRDMEMSVKLGGKATVTGGVKAKGTPTKAGPSDEDIDYTKWGYNTCVEKPMPTPPMVQRALMLLQGHPGAASILPHMTKMPEHGRRLQGGVPGGIPGGMPEWAKCFAPPMTQSTVAV